VKLDKKHPAYVLGYMVVISALFTAGIVAVQIATADRVERNERMRKYRAIVTLFAPSWKLKGGALPDDRVVELFRQRIVEGELASPDPRGGRATIKVYRAFESEEKRKLTGAAFPVRGNGFWAPIEGYFAVTPDGKEALGVVFVEQRETPGLGGRITEKAFTNRFRPEWRKEKGKEPLEVTLPDQGQKIIYIGRGEPTGAKDPRHGRSVDAITGATQTSMAVERLLNQDIRRFQGAVDEGLRRVE
jgi:Na+-transporting NADH:ubiquinone oxidoreductase subunit C